MKSENKGMAKMNEIDIDCLSAGESVRKGYINMLEGTVQYATYLANKPVELRGAILAKCYSCMQDLKYGKKICDEETCPLYQYGFVYWFGCSASDTCEQNNKYFQKYKKVSPEEAITAKCAKCKEDNIDCNETCPLYS